LKFIDGAGEGEVRLVQRKCAAEPAAPAMTASAVEHGFDFVAIEQPKLFRPLQ
jgi:hypothetical protein